jgi:hypothetical protein
MTTPSGVWSMKDLWYSSQLGSLEPSRLVVEARLLDPSDPLRPRGLPDPLDPSDPPDPPGGASDAVSKVSALALVEASTALVPRAGPSLLARATAARPPAARPPAARTFPDRSPPVVGAGSVAVQPRASLTPSRAVGEALVSAAPARRTRPVQVTRRLGSELGVASTMSL